MKRRLPIGIQDFIGIREDGFCYVDKTALIHDLISSSGKTFFLSRPRRFGKSLLCSTLGAIFENRRELFKEIAGRPALAIDSLDWEWKEYPVIKLDLNPGNYKNGIVILNSALHNALYNIAHSYNLELRGQFASEQFSNLIRDLHEHLKEKVVVIIDEYDKPLLSTMDDDELHIAMRNELKGFYGVLKSSDKDLQFVFLTGVTKFSHVSIFSDLNHLIDLTLDPRYADICGITQEEVEQNFIPEIETVLKDTGKSRDEYMNDLRRFYNGYRFSEKSLSVYNPFGLLNHFDKNGRFLPYWYETGTPTFLINLIIKQKINIIELTNLQVGYEDFHKYDIENMKAEPLLYQSGYLTIRDYDQNINLFTLDYPNDEVRIASGRIDTLVETKNSVYCFEFKLNGTAEEALAQINTKEYLLPWEGSGKKLLKVGVVFDHEKRNISEWKMTES